MLLFRIKKFKKNNNLKYSNYALYTYRTHYIQYYMNTLKVKRYATYYKAVKRLYRTFLVCQMSEVREILFFYTRFG